MTMGQRIAQKRKEQGLSQEGLGEQLGVSRQAIYKWESGAAVPEIDKLIALSRLFGVSVGWLLGVEELPQEGSQSTPEADASATAPEETAGELTEAQLQMVEEIVERYTAALPRPRRRRWPFVLAGAILAVVFLNLFQALDTLRLQQQSIFNDLSRVESSVDNQIGSISSRVEEILKAQNSLVADYGVELLSTDPTHNTATFSIYAVPKTYVEGMTVEFIAENGVIASDRVARAGETGSNQRFSADLVRPPDGSITISALLVTAGRHPLHPAAGAVQRALQRLPSRRGSDVLRHRRAAGPAGGQERPCDIAGGLYHHTAQHLGLGRFRSRRLLGSRVGPGGPVQKQDPHRLGLEAL